LDSNYTSFAIRGTFFSIIKFVSFVDVVLKVSSSCLSKVDPVTNAALLGRDVAMFDGDYLCFNKVH
jgi:hypothetical protein